VSCWESLVRIPAFMVAPGLEPGEHGGLVGHADLPATLLGAFGLAAATDGAEDWGRSWWRLRGHLERPLHEFVAIRSARLASGSQTSYPLLALVERDHKIVRSLGDGLDELYDVTRDPGETHDLAYAEPALLLRLRARLALYQDLWR
jgi:arylsulfatase A-like enzyme